MGPMATQRLVRLEVDWGENNFSTNHSPLFRATGLQEADYHDLPPPKWSAPRHGLNRRRTEMAIKKHRPEQAVAKLRQVGVLVSQGQSVAVAIRAVGMTEVTYYR